MITTQVGVLEGRAVRAYSLSKRQWRSSFRFGPAYFAMVACVLTAGCTVSTNGTVVAAPTLGQAPRPVPTAALSSVLLSPREASSVVGASLSVASSRQGLYENRPLDDGCLVWGQAQRHTYEGSGWTAVRVEELRDRPDNADHIIYQAAVAFPDAASAQELFAGQEAAWSRCDDRRVDLRDPGDPDAHYWSLNTATEQHGVLTITRSQEDTPGWSCQRVMTVTNNVVVDLAACAMDVNDRGVELALLIVDKIAGE